MAKQIKKSYAHQQLNLGDDAAMVGVYGHH